MTTTSREDGQLRSRSYFCCISFSKLSFKWEDRGTYHPYHWPQNELPLGLARSGYWNLQPVCYFNNQCNSKKRHSGERTFLFDVKKRPGHDHHYKKVGWSSKIRTLPIKHYFFILSQRMFYKKGRVRIWKMNLISVYSCKNLVWRIRKKNG